MRRRREGGKKWKEKEERKKIEIHHFHINYNAPCLFPPNLRGGGGTRCIMVYVKMVNME